MRYWVKVGPFQLAFVHLREVIDWLVTLSVGRVDFWLLGARNGIETPRHHGDNYIELYKGDLAGNLFSALLWNERIAIEEALLDAGTSDCESAERPSLQCQHWYSRPCDVWRRQAG